VCTRRVAPAAIEIDAADVERDAGAVTSELRVAMGWLPCAPVAWVGIDDAARGQNVSFAP
ncbi:unnamed protein product, partial [Prorocentrum cordatum]